MAKVLVLGAGMMGTAITIPLTDNGHDVRLVGTHLDDHIIEEIHQSRTHPKLRSAVPEVVKPYTVVGLSEAMQGIDMVILGVNSLGTEWAASMLAPLLNADFPVLSLTKGLAGDGRDLHLLPEVFRSNLPGNYQKQIRLAAIGGPSIAGELAARRHTSVVITSSDPSLLSEVDSLLRTPYYHIWTSTDVVGVEVCVALKNIYALAVGTVQGLLEKEGLGDDGDEMHNLAAAIFAQALNETAYLVDHMGGQLASVYTLPGAGDLYVTCMGGRNMRMGRMLGLGMSYEDAKANYMPDETIEGAELAFAIDPTVQAMIDQGEFNHTALPLLTTMIDIVCQNAVVKMPWDEFFDRWGSPHSSLNS